MHSSIESSFDDGTHARFGSSQTVDQRDPRRQLIELTAPMIAFWCLECLGFSESRTREVLRRVFLSRKEDVTQRSGVSLRDSLRSLTRSVVAELWTNEPRGHEANVPQVPASDALLEQEDWLLYRTAFTFYRRRLPQPSGDVAQRVLIQCQDPMSVASEFGVTEQSVEESVSEVRNFLRSALVGLVPDDSQPACTESLGELQARFDQCTRVATSWVRSQVEATTDFSATDEYTEKTVDDLDSTLHPSPRLLVGEQLASGGLSDIRYAEDELGRRVAIKTLRDDVRGSRSMRLRFEREVIVCSKLTHPGIVTLLNHGVVFDRERVLHDALHSGPKPATAHRFRRDAAT